MTVDIEEYVPGLKDGSVTINVDHLVGQQTATGAGGAQVGSLTLISARGNTGAPFNYATLFLFMGI